MMKLSREHGGIRVKRMWPIRISEDMMQIGITDSGFKTSWRFLRSPLSHYTVEGGCVVIFRFDSIVGRYRTLNVQLWGV